MTPSVGNFLLLRFPGDGGRDAKAADAYLSARGFILRAVVAYGLPDCLRMTIGTAEANEGVVAALTKFMKGERGGVIILAPPLGAPIVDRLAIIGLGLIGSSIARAARRTNAAKTIIAGDADEGVRARVKELGIADEVAPTLAQAVAGADLVIFCVPVGANSAVAQEIGPHLKAGAVVSDVGSVKSAVIAAIAPHLAARRQPRPRPSRRRNRAIGAGRRLRQLCSCIAGAS